MHRYKSSLKSIIHVSHQTQLSTCVSKPMLDLPFWGVGVGGGCGIEFLIDVPEKEKAGFQKVCSRFGRGWQRDAYTIEKAIVRCSIRRPQECV